MSAPGDPLGGPLEGLRVLLTGATGFVGAHVLSSLLDAGARVVAPVRRAPEGASTGVEHVVVERWTPDLLRARLEPVAWDAVVNCAAYGVHPQRRDPAEAAAVNAVAPAILVALAAERGARGFVHLGTCSEYDAAAASMPLGPGAPVDTVRLYGATKLAGTALARSGAAAHGLPFAALRLYNVYGPGEAPHRLLPAIAAGLREGTPVDLSDGLQERDWMFVGDAANAIVHVLGDLAVEEERGATLHDLCTGRATSVRDLALLAARVLDRDPALLRFGAIARRPDDVPLVVGDPEPLARDHGWRAGITIEDGVQRTLLSNA